MNKKLLNLEETSKLLRISKRYLQDLRKDDSFPSPIVLGKQKVAYWESDIVDWLNGGGLDNER